MIYASEGNGNTYIPLCIYACVPRVSTSIFTKTGVFLFHEPNFTVTGEPDVLGQVERVEEGNKGFGSILFIRVPHSSQEAIISRHDQGQARYGAQLLEKSLRDFYQSRILNA